MKKEGPTICLNMIVKNEREILKRCFDSVKPLIGHWVIVDTGSTDGTQDFIREYLHDIPGELYERPWKDFASNRSEAIDLAQSRGDYLLFMDADDWLEIDAPFERSSLDRDMYEMRCGAGGFSHRRPQLAKTGLPWKYVGVIHEYLSCDQPHTTGFLEQIRYITGHGSARNKVPREKFWTHIQLLEEGLRSEPDNSRYVFYLAESYRDVGKKEEAIKTYQRRVEMGRWDQEVFWSLFQIARLQYSLSLPIETVIASYYRAHYFRPHRAEPVYYLAEIFNEQKNFTMAYALLKSKEAIPNPSTEDILFKLDWIEDYGLLFLRSICSYYLGHYRESLDCCDALLEKHNLPESIERQTRENRTYPLSKCAEERDLSLR